MHPRAAFDRCDPRNRKSQRTDWTWVHARTMTARVANQVDNAAMADFRSKSLPFPNGDYPERDKPGDRIKCNGRRREHHEE